MNIVPYLDSEGHVLLSFEARPNSMTVSLEPKGQLNYIEVGEGFDPIGVY
jgi:hypothetical protein